jgi:hypothetical protein
MISVMAAAATKMRDAIAAAARLPKRTCILSLFANAVTAT